MTHTYRALFLSKRLNTAFRHAHFRSIYRTFHKQDGIILPTSAKSNVYSFNISTMKNLKWMSRPFCTITEDAVSENKLIENDKIALLHENFHNINLSDPNVIKTFRRLCAIHRGNKMHWIPGSGEKFKNFVISSEFKDYCNAVEKTLPMLSAQELKLLLHLDIFKVPTSSVLMQKICHLILGKINEFTPLDVISLHARLNLIRDRKNPSIQLIKSACEQYFKSKLFEDLHLEIQYKKMAYYCSENLPIKAKRKLLEIISSKFHIIKTQLTLKTLARVFASFSTEDLKRYFRPEMYELLVPMIKSRTLTFMDIRYILRGMEHLVGNKISYDEEVFNTLADKILAKNLPLPLLAECIFSFLRIGYLSWPLVHSLEHRLAATDVDMNTVHFGYIFASILSKSYYHPFGYTGDDADHIQCLKKLESMEFELSLIQKISWCLFITVLGCPQKIEKLNDLFNDLAVKSMEDNFLENISIGRIEAIITLNAFARRHFPDEVRELPEAVLKKCYIALRANGIKDVHIDLNKLVDLKTSLEYCTTSMYHVIDFAVLLNSEKKPMEVTIDKKDNSLIKIEDIKKPPESELILYQINKGERVHKFINCSGIAGTVRLYLETFEPFQCKIVLFLLSEYIRLSHDQRESYLQNKISESLQ